MGKDDKKCVEDKPMSTSHHESFSNTMDDAISSSSKIPIENGMNPKDFSDARDAKKKAIINDPLVARSNEKPKIQFLIPKLNVMNIDYRTYTTLMSGIEFHRYKKSPCKKNGILKELETCMNASALKSKNEKRQSVKHAEDIYLQIGQPYQILTSNKKLFYPGKQKQEVKQVANDKNNKIFNCLCQDNHQDTPLLFYIQCDECENW